MSVLSSVFYFTFYLFELLQRNLEETRASEVFLIFFVGIFAIILFYQLVEFFLKDRYKSSLVCLLAVVMFFLFGKFFYYHGYLFQLLRMQFGYIRYRWLLPLWGVLFCFLTYCIIAYAKNVKTISDFLLKTTLLLALFGIIRGGFDIYGIYFSEKSYSPFDLVVSTSFKYKPDIYYIILDGYPRKDTLSALFEFDNSSFLDSLSCLGFKILETSCSNYACTQYSIPSTINFNYIGTKELSLNDCKKRWGAAFFLKGQGYSIINISSNFGLTSRINIADKELVKRWTGPFSSYFFTQTALFPFVGKFSFLHKKDIIVEQVNALKEVVALQKKPLFVICHIICPHDPPAFSEDGTAAVSTKEDSIFSLYNIQDRKNLVTEIKNINNLILSSIKNILAQSKKPPVIILQSDHGSMYSAGQVALRPLKKENEKVLLKERMSNLSALYLPEGGDQKVYPHMTNVNTFRIIFDYYLGTSLGLLPDVCYFPDYPPFDKRVNVYKSEEINKIKFPSLQEVIN